MMSATFLKAIPDPGISSAPRWNKVKGYSQAVADAGRDAGCGNELLDPKPGASTLRSCFKDPQHLPGVSNLSGQQPSGEREEMVNNPTFEEPIASIPTPSMPSRPKVDPVDPELQRMCEKALPHLVWLPRSAVQLSPWKATEVAQVSKIILHLTRDNIAALAVIATLSVFGMEPLLFAMADWVDAKKETKPSKGSFLEEKIFVKFSS
eukprot:symbB.v1.2.022939.t1/scaffold2066.1/size90764/2